MSCCEDSFVSLRNARRHPLYLRAYFALPGGDAFRPADAPLPRFALFKNSRAVGKPAPFRTRFALLGQVYTVSVCKRILAAYTISRHALRSWRVLYFSPQTHPCRGLRRSKAPALLTALRLSGHASRSWTVLHRFGPQTRRCSGLRCSKIPAPLAGLRLSGRASHCVDDFASSRPTNAPLPRFVPFKSSRAVDSLTPFRTRIALLGGFCTISARKRILAAICAVQKFWCR